MNKSNEIKGVLPMLINWEKQKKARKDLFTAGKRVGTDGGGPSTLYHLRQSGLKGN